MFSTISKIADSNFLIGFFIPSLLGSMVIIALLGNNCWYSDVYLNTILKDKIEDIAIFFIITWILAIVLSICNNYIYRMLEGYQGPLALAYWRKINQELFRCEWKAIKEIEQELSELHDQVHSDKKSKYCERIRIFRREFPTHEHLVLPTRFGNVIRSSETYPLYVYGVDSIPAWLRLIGVVPESYQSNINYAKSQMDFFVNGWIISLLIALISLVRFVANISFIIVRGESLYNIQWLFPISVLFGVMITLISYRGAIDRAYAWGDLVRSAFDLYLPMLAKQLGYKLAQNNADRRQFWDAVNSMFLYLEPLDPEKWPSSNDSATKTR